MIHEGGQERTGEKKKSTGACGVKAFISTHIRGELGAVDVTLLEYGGVSVRSFMMRMALAMDGMGAGRGP